MWAGRWALTFFGLVLFFGQKTNYYEVKCILFSLIAFGFYILLGLPHMKFSYIFSGYVNGFMFLRFKSLRHAMLIFV